MQYREELLWILDKIGPRKGIWDEEAARENIDFVHSLGLKCDCVGWCKMDLAAQGVETVLEKIGAFCRENGWKARGYYSRFCVDEDSEWYELVPQSFKDKTVSKQQEFPCMDGQIGELPIIHAYRETIPGPKGILATYVPERMLRACKTQHVPDVTFMWLPDVGKYAAEQYYALFPTQTIAHLGVDWDLRWANKADIARMDGWLPRLIGLFDQMHINLPDCYLAQDLPKGGMALAHHDVGREPYYTRDTILIHRELARSLLREKAVPASALRPAMVVKALTPGYTCINATAAPYPTEAFLAENRRACEVFAAISRPIRMVTEKEALTQLRRAKKERKEAFAKPLPKAQADALMDTVHAPLAPYYRVANGGLLDDNGEYELLSCTRTTEESVAFHTSMAREELLDHTFKGLVIAQCADGDMILLGGDGSVSRISHEEPVVLSTWQTLAQFIYEVLTES